MANQNPIEKQAKIKEKSDLEFPTQALEDSINVVLKKDFMEKIDKRL